MANPANFIQRPPADSAEIANPSKQPAIFSMPVSGSEDSKIPNHFNGEKQLTFYDSNEKYVTLYVSEVLIGKCKVWLDAEMNDREYIALNNTIIYLDTIDNL